MEPIKFCHYMAFDDEDGDIASRPGDHVQACIMVEFDLSAHEGTFTITGEGMGEDGTVQPISTFEANIVE